MTDDKRYTIGSLFSGFGGIERGLRSIGHPIWHSEIEPFCDAILKHHWTGVPNLGDITQIEWDNVTRPDIITLGFPCQDISTAGKRIGITGSRSGLWKEGFKAISILRPRLVLVENVSALLNRGIDTVCGDLASIGYDCEWSLVGACTVGAPHHRHRVFILAYPEEFGVQTSSTLWRISGQESTTHGSGEDDVNASIEGSEESWIPRAVGYHWQIIPSDDWLVDGPSFGLSSVTYEELARVVGENEATKIAKRWWKESIKALGNGVVGQCVETLIPRIKEIFDGK